MNNKTEPRVFFLILLYLMCYFMNLFRFPDLLMLVLGSIFCLVLLVKQKKVRIDFGGCLLAITMFSYCIVVFGIRAVAIMMPYIPLVMYILAHYLACEIQKKENSDLQFTYVLYSLVFGHAIYGILNSGMYLAGTGVEGTRYWVDFWKQQMMPGTQLVVYFLSVFAVLFPAIIYFRKRKSVNGLIILVSMFLIYASLATRTRTTILSLGVVFCGQIVLYAILERKKVMKSVTPKKTAIFLICIAAVIAVLTFALKDLKIVREFIENLSKDGGIFNNVRFVAQRKALTQLWHYPMGGGFHELGIAMAHNLWLDMANSAGLIPFIAFTAYTFWTIYELIRFVFTNHIGTEVKLMVAGIYVAYFLYYTIEPALNASIHFITPWILINGLVHGYISKK